MYLITTLSSFVCLGYISSVKWPQITRLWKNVTKWTVFSGGSRPSDKGGARSQKKFFRLFGPQFGLKIRGRWAPRALLLDPPLVLTLGSLKPRANGRNIVGQQLPTLLDVTCCVRLHTPLHVVACCCAKFETGQQLPTFLLFRDRRSVAQQCWIRLHGSSNIVGATHAHYAWITKTYGLYSSHDALHVPNLLGVVASVCTPLTTCTLQFPTFLAQ